MLSSASIVLPNGVNRNRVRSQYELRRGKKFLKLIKLSFDTSLKVTRAFTRTNVLKDEPLKTFLEVNKHKIYHLWCGYAKCCECSLDYKLTNNKSLLKDQFTILYDIGSKHSEGHVVRKNNMVVQHCICCINVNPHCSLDKLDITILSSLLTNCATLSPTNEMWLKSVREIRNNICHALSTTCFDRGRLDKWWTKLEGAVLGLSSKVAIYYEESIKDVVNLLKNSDLTLDNRKEFMDLIKAENEKFYEDFIKNQNNNFEKFAEKQEQQCVLLKEDVTKLLQQHKDELSIDLNNLKFEIRQINLPSSTSKSSSTMVLPSDQLATQSSSTATVTLDEQATHSRNMDTETDRSNIEGSDILYVEWRFANPPDSWKVSEMKTALNQMSAMIKQWFKVEFVYIGSLVITTSVPKHVLLEREFLQSAIKSFLENIVKVCNIDTSKHERIQVDFTVMNRIPDVVLPNDSTCIKREDIRDLTKKKDGVQCQRCHDKLKKIHHLKKYNTELQQNFKRYIVSFKKTTDKFEKQTVKKRADLVHELSFKKVNLEADVEVAEAREPSFKKVKLEADLERAEARDDTVVTRILN
ncbi:unnamed protein product [Mytilus edulis]|uniref:DZIP3-like HEPN domain-containing protein n=1 Tax=Mytilus edulis TaxID=6550 RepID=A0A8S3R8F6_MYTED|nr:unnamed protein product [Mytilus edulis]